MGDLAPPNYPYRVHLTTTYVIYAPDEVTAQRLAEGYDFSDELPVEETIEVSEDR